MVNISEDLDELFEELNGLPATLEQFADAFGLPVSATRAAAKTLDLPRFCNGFAITREGADALVEELESLGYDFTDDDETDESDESADELEAG